MEEDSHRSREGELLGGKYRLEARLGSGGMGDVYRAVNVTIGRAVAIKVLRAEHARSDEVAQRFLREARAANLVRHENVVDVLDMGHDEEGTPFIVQELLHGHDLDSLLASRLGPLPIGRVLELLLPVIDAVAFAHGKGVVHRDLKPANVFLAEEKGRVVPKLLDFGISHVVSTEPRVTAAGAVLGTPWYMSPEQVRASPDVDARTDVWALGVILYQMVSGTPPFQADSGPALFVKICTDEPPPVEQHAPGLDPALAAIIRRCMRRPAAERYPSAAELAVDLRRVQSGLPLVGPERPSPETLIHAPAPVQEPLDLQELRAAPTLAAVDANSFEHELAFPPKKPPSVPKTPVQPKAALAKASDKAARHDEPDTDEPPPSLELQRVPVSQKTPARKPASSSAPSSAPRGAGSAGRLQGPAADRVLVDEPLQSIDLASPGRVSPRRVARALPEPSRPLPPEQTFSFARLMALVLMLVVVAVGVRALLWVFPGSIPVVGFLGSILHPLPDGAFGAFGLALGLAAISICVAALRQRPVWWWLLVLGIGSAILAYCAVVSAIGWEGGDPPVRDLVPVGAALVPLALGVFGLQRLVRASEQARERMPALGIAIAGLFLALQVARAPSVDPAPPPPATRAHAQE
jgi:serine/threonine protein kinase